MQEGLFRITLNLILLFYGLYSYFCPWSDVKFVAFTSAGGVPGGVHCLHLLTNE